uniref:Secreted protein n=1 Tax=Cacopsylla melanoneura TaxID=428564 RepID=A0A8D9BJB9_9HEMI
MKISLVLCCMVALGYSSTTGLSGDYLGQRMVEKKLTLLEDRNVLEDLATNSLTDMNFSWGNMLGVVMQLLFNPGPGEQVVTAPSKSDNNIESETITTGATTSPWANVLSIGLKILTAFLGGGGAPNDGIDKVDNSSPMQGILAAVFSTMLGSKDPEQVAVMAKQAGEFINIVVNLLDALKTSFSHRSLSARSLGKKDSVSDAAMASISLLKGYVRTMKSTDEDCMKRYMCDANHECITGLNGANTIYCQIGTYASSYLLETRTSSQFDAFNEAGRQGRSGVNCQQLYAACNEV